MSKQKPKESHKKTKILAVGDFHGDTRFATKMAKKAKEENVDLVILTGDHTMAETSIDGLIGPFAKNKKPVLIIPGNHESAHTNAMIAEIYAPYTKNLHGYYFTKKNLGIFGAGTAHIGIHAISDDEIFNLLKRSHNKIKNLKKQIMVTHIHPEDSTFEFSGYPGSSAVKKAIVKFQPDIAICSHIHEAAGLEEKIGKTQVINVARKAKIFEI